MAVGVMAGRHRCRVRLDGAATTSVPSAGLDDPGDRDFGLEELSSHRLGWNLAWPFGSGTVPPLRSVPTISMLLATILCVVLAGCASWTDRSRADTELAASGDPASSGRGNGLRPVRQNPRAVIVSVDFVPIRLENPAIDDDSTPPAQSDLWRWADESAIDAETRRRFHANGLRVGRLIREDRFRDALAERSVETDNVVETFLSHAEIASHQSHGSRRIPMRLGDRHELPLHRPLTGRQVFLARLGGETIGRTLRDPQFVFAVTPALGQTAREVELRFRPEIQHGVVKNQYVSSDAAIRIDARREAWSLKPLELRATLVEDEVLVITATQPPRGLGRRVLTGESSDHGDQQLVMLLKLEQAPQLAGPS